jgi:hypothetical protein
MHSRYAFGAVEADTDFLGQREFGKYFARISHARREHGHLGIAVWLDI